MLDRAEIRRTGAHLAAMKLDSGLVPWFEGGPIDPWNHAEAAIGMALAGEHDAAIDAVEALFSLQNRDGSFCHFYLPRGVKEPNRDTNVVAYSMLGLLAVMSAVPGYEPEGLFLGAAAAIDWVVSLQRLDGGFPMLQRPDGTLHARGLLAGSCSILNSLEAGIALAAYFEQERPEWKIAHVALSDYLLADRGRIAGKEEWAMDWYYPSLAGLEAPHPQVRELFYTPGLGVRCISNRPWYTAAETAEASMAHHLAGQAGLGREVLETTRRFRRGDGSYFTGLVEPEGVSYPGGEVSSYTAAAVLIADDVLRSDSRGSLAGHFATRLHDVRRG